MMKKVLLLFFGLISITIAQEKVKHELEIKSFNELRLEGSATWILIPSEENRLVVESKKEDIKDYVEILHSGNLMTIDVTGKNKNVGKLFQGVTFYVYAKHLTWVELKGTGKVETDGVFKASTFKAGLSGSGKLIVEVDCDKFVGMMHGTSSLIAKGDAKTANIDVEGVGKFKGYDLVCENIVVYVKGVGGAQVNCMSNLDATLKGVGSIHYMGNPKDKKLDVSGLGAIKPYSK